MHGYLLANCIEKSDEELVAIRSTLSQINLILNRVYIPNDYCITNCYWDLRKRTLAWLKVCKKKIEKDNQKITLLSKTTNTNNALSIFHNNIT